MKVEDELGDLMVERRAESSEEVEASLVVEVAHFDSCHLAFPVAGQSLRSFLTLGPSLVKGSSAACLS